MVIESIAGLPAFLLYFVVGSILVALYVVAYSFVTAHDELALIRQNVAAAAVALGLSLIGFALPLSSAIINSVSILDCVIWGVIALLVQIATYLAVRLVIPDLSGRIEANEMSAALFVGAASLAAGALNAASMTY
jgi:putative membrane protein